MHIDEVNLKLRDPAYAKSWEVAIYDQLNRINLPRRPVLATHTAPGQLPSLHYHYQADRPVQVYGVGIILYYRDDPEPICGLTLPYVHEFALREGQTVTLTIPIIHDLRITGAPEEKKVIDIRGTAEPVGVLKEILSNPHDKALRQLRNWNHDLNKRNAQELLASGAISKEEHGRLLQELRKKLRKDPQPIIRPE